MHGGIPDALLLQGILCRLYGRRCGLFAEKAENCAPDYCFPNKPEDIAVLRFAISRGCTAKAPYYLGNLFYDKLQWEEACALWETSAKTDPDFAAVHRNLSLVYYNKKKDAVRAKEEMEKAFALDTGDVRIFLELDQLYKKLGKSFEERLAGYEAHRELIEQRDDLYIEYITLVNLCGEHEKAYECIMGHSFHPWEGGEGKSPPNIHWPYWKWQRRPRPAAALKTPKTS